MRINSLFVKILRGYYKSRARLIASSLLPILTKGEKVLDVGAGTMEVAEELYLAGMKVEGVDVIDINVTKLPFKKFDGFNLPYRDNQFGVVMLIFVLHHIPREKQDILLRECRRVASRAVLVAEDVYENKFELALVKWFDKINGWVAKDMALPLSFRSEEDWKKLFGQLALGRVGSRAIRSNRLRPTRHKLFVIEKGGEK